MKRCILLLFLILSTIPLFSLQVSAYESSESYVTEQLEQIENSIMQHIPSETQNLLEQLDISELSINQILSLEPKKFLQVAKDFLKSQWAEPCKTAGRMFGILLFSAILSPIKDSLLKESSVTVFALVSSLCLCTIFLPSLLTCISSCVESLQNCANFMLVLIPILAAILTISGKIATAGAYQLILFAACQLISQLTVSVAVPLLSVYTAVGSVTAIFPDFNIQSIANGIKTILCWGLGIATTVFVSYLSLQTFVTSNIDVVTQKASRFLMGSFIPVVGTILSDAFGAAQGCLGLIQSTVGTFGIIVALCIVLPTLLQTILWYCISWIGLQCGSLLQTNELNRMLKVYSNSFAILLALQCSMLLLVLVSLSLVIVVGAGGK